MNDDLQRLSNLSPEKRALLTLRRMQSKLDAIERAKTEPIAIVGMGCRFPGGASDPEAYWQLLRDGVDAIIEIPSTRWDLETFYDPNPETPDKMSTRWGGFLRRVDQFDPIFFGIAPREAMYMDPQQRLLLEVAWEALEHAGQPIDQLAGSQTGVFIGISNSDHFYLQIDNNPITDAYLETGNRNCFAAGRLCYVFNFRGPAVAIDTVCSSSLVAVHMACQSLRLGECRMAVAGGINLILSPLVHIMVTKWGLMAPDGRCKTFDARANGFVRSEGCGLVVLKRLSDALADGDRILALIRGSAINQDGRSNGLTAPNGQSQQALVRQALANAGVDPSEVTYVETHGTGSNLGDTIEVESLAAVLGQPRPDGKPCILGAVKTNIGHLEPAAGVAGLIKAVQALRHEMIPPNLHFQTINPNIKLDGTRFLLPTEPHPWPAGDTPRYAGVSSFGFSGTNAHVILEEYRSEDLTERPERSDWAYMLPMSARTTTALNTLAQSYRDLLVSPQAPSIHDVCYTASARRIHHPHHRLAVVGTTAQELAERLDAFVRGEMLPGVSVGDVEPGSTHRLVFIFSGQGGQWVGMGRQLLEQEPVFRSVIEQCDAAFQPYIDWSLIDQITCSDDASRLDEVDVFQPMTFAVQVALAALWRSWGIAPDAVVGHSMGEIAAAYVAGVLSLSDAARVICRRSQILRRISGQGAMLVTEVSIPQAKALLAPYADRVSIAASNSVRSTVLSGDTRVLEVLRTTLEAQSVFCRWVKSNVAAHSPQLDPLLSDFRAMLGEIAPQAAALPLYSTVTGLLCAGPEMDTAYWVRNLREPVLFGTTVLQLIADGKDHFLEIGPHPVLTIPVKHCLQERGQTGLVLSSLQREKDERVTLLETLGTFYTIGYPVSWATLYPNKGRCVTLPSYPWQRQRYWVEPAELGTTGGWRKRHGHGEIAHPLLGAPIQLATAPDTYGWEGRLHLKQLAYLSDHQVQDAVVLPAAAYLEMSLAVANAIFGAGVHTLAQVVLHQMLVLTAEAAVDMQVVATTDSPSTAKIQIFSRAQSSEVSHWTLHASVIVRRAGGEVEQPLVTERIADIQARCPEQISDEAHYQAMSRLGFQYGPYFRGVRKIWRRAGEALARVQFPEGVAAPTSSYNVHPALLDACLQVVEATTYELNPQDGQTSPFLPVEFKQVRLFQSFCKEVVWVHARRYTNPTVAPDSELGDLDLLNERGELLLTIRGLRMQQLSPKQQAQDDPVSKWMYTLQWQPQLLPPIETRTDAPGTWIIFADRQGIAQALSQRLTAQGQRVLLVVPDTEGASAAGIHQLSAQDPAAYTKFLQSNTGAQHPPCRGIIHLWSLDTPSGCNPASLDPLLGWGSILPLVQGLVQTGIHARLWLVTRGVQPIGVPLQPLAIEQSPQWGLGLTIAQEYPELRCTRIDLSPQAMAAEVEALLAELNAPVFEDQVALRSDARYVARVVPWDAAAEAEPLFSAGDKPFRMEMTTPGVLDRLILRATHREPPGPGEVEIQVEAAGLNFLDVLLALDVIPDPLDETGPRLGSEYAGRIVAVGPGVTDLQVGQEVITLTPGNFSTFVTTHQRFVVPKPSNLSFAEAATLPVAFLTAYYALHYVARLEPGERILIHAASGGVGLAAIQMAKRIGAEIFATAGSPEKRAFLRSLGVAHVFDSRSLEFADEIRAATNGEGVDVVLNSLAGEFISASFGILRPYGRFIELGKRDYYEDRKLGLKPFLKNLTFALVDLRTMQVQRPDFVRRLLQEVVTLVERGELSPIVRQVVPVSQSVEAFHTMAQAKHIGKIAISFADRATALIAPPKLTQLARPDGAYVVTGGFGGIGLRVVQWLVEQGARHLVVIGRSAPSEATRTVLDELRSRGVTIAVCQVDVTDRAAMEAMFEAATAELPAVRGVIHAAAVLDDGVLLQQTPERFARVLAPKIAGAWNLHELTLGQPLDFFVLFSSAASLMGSPGQANYAAGNAFLDTLVYHRLAQGLPGLSINWGSWAEVGLAAQAGRAQRLATQGITSFTPEEGLEAMGQVMRLTTPRIGVVAFNLRQWQQAHPSTMALPLFAELRKLDTLESAQRSSGSSVRAELQAAEVGQRWGLLEAHLRDQIAQVLRLAPHQISVRKPLGSMGFDSLTALELRNRLESSLGLILPGTLIWGYPTVNALVPYLAEKMEISLKSDQEPQAESPKEPQPLPQDDSEIINLSIGLGVLDEIEQLSDDQVRRMLSK